MIRILEIREKALIDGKLKPKVSDNLPRAFGLVNMLKTL
jgi:hypothetical protein